MGRQGPEHRKGWRTRIEVDGVGIDVLAAHHSRSRLPRGHEIARQYGRSGHFSLVEETTFEWRIVPSRGHRSATCRQNPNETFSIDGHNTGRTDLLQAVEEWAGRFLAHAPQGRAPGAAS